MREGRNSGLWGNQKAQKQRRKMKRLREEIKGADSANRENKKHEEKIKCDGGK